VIHRDVKGANILVSNDGIVKLSDFGCAKQLMVSMNSISTEKESEEFAKSLKGSVPWIAPEVITESKYSPEADIWSFGCTILEMATAKIPWS
jgi:mitogen-activated protein kinase kinase kinase